MRPSWKIVIALILVFIVSLSFILFGKTLWPRKPQKASPPSRQEIFSPGFNTNELNSLISLPYVQGYFPVPDKVGVVRYDRTLSFPGLNLFSSGHKASAYLMDMKGNILHQWSYDRKRIWPEIIGSNASPFWDDVRLYPNGDLLAIYHLGGIIKLDKDSNLLWSYKCASHHDIDIDQEGKIYTLTEDKVQLKEGLVVLDNSLLILSPDGKALKKLSFLKMMIQSKRKLVQEVLKRVLGIAVNGGEDIYHANTCQLLDGRLSSLSPMYKKGNVLTSMLTISMIAIINPQTEDFEWILGPLLWFQGQHDPKLLDNGDILTFDNHLDGSKEQSRILQFDPLTKKVVWEYKEKGFYTDTQGKNSRLENGNTLILESNSGRAFEITPDGKTVWEFFNPNTTGEKNELIAAIYAFYRLSPKDAAWLMKKDE
jgi:hypothetical protein